MLLCTASLANLSRIFIFALSSAEIHSMPENFSIFSILSRVIFLVNSLSSFHPDVNISVLLILVSFSIVFGLMLVTFSA